MLKDLILALMITFTAVIAAKVLLWVWGVI
jgi:hypothetical protein